MFNNIALGPDGHTNHNLSVLRGKKRKGALANDMKIISGISFHADPALGLSGSYTSPPGRMLELEAHMQGAGEWVGLHFEFPARDISGAGVMGFAARISAAETCVVQTCLRSMTEDGFQDCFFDKHLLLRPEESSHLDALQIGYRDSLPLHAKWRELILFLPTESFNLALIDLRLFLV
ncbi:MAG: hypothetical protein GJ677_02505 [Rhodobacteraceae bacterium]|nr:hypothetical protein [Paracoccaceae bacterium]